MHKIKQLVEIDNPVPRGAALVAPGTGIVVGKQTGALLVRQDLSFSAVTVAMVDGTTNGSIGNLPLCTLAARNYQVLGAEVELTAFSRVGTNITATATVKCAVGTALETTNDTFIATARNILASQSAPAMVSGAGALAKTAGATGAATPLTVLAAAGTQQLFLNFGIADAGSAGNDSLLVTGTVRLLLVDMGA